jgi:histidinol-phosphate aminotransferase
MSRFIQLAQPGIGELHRYEPGRPLEEVARELGLSDALALHKLASNENALGPSPRAIAAVQALAPRLHIYPDGGAYALTRALSQKLDLPPECILVCNGSNEAIELLGHVFLRPGTGIVMADRAFVIYRLMADLFGAETVAVPMVDDTHDPVAMVEAITPQTRLLFVANPNNPTGTMVDQAALDALIASLPDHVIPVMDEAYVELLPPAHRPDMLRHVRAGRPVVVLRTFSKAYGLAGLRVGYALAPPEAIDLLQRVRQPFNVNAAALVAAEAALQDDAFVAQTRQLVAEGRAFLTAAFDRLGLTYTPSVANFVLVKVGQGREICAELQRRGVIVRPMDGYRMPDSIRVTVGTREENERFVRELEMCLS